MSRDIEALLRRWSGMVQAAARRFGFDAPTQDELEQDLRIRLWRALARQGENPRGLAASYVYDAAMSAATDLLRRQRRERRHVAIEVLDGSPSRSADPSVEIDDMVTALESALAGLSDDRRVAVRLHLDGRSRHEIAEVMGWSEARARNLLYRGLADLRLVLTGRRDPR